MVFNTKRRIYKVTAIFLLFTFLFDIIIPIPSFALTSGPNQPEFSSFEPVATTNMVNEFTGDFTYNLPVLNIPGPNGGGYALSLSYHSGTTPEEEASWVGYGWTLNPGSIIRNKRGFPDDWNGVDVEYHNKAPANQTVSVGGSVNFEIFSYDPPVGLNASIRYNNYKGFGYNAGIGVQLANGVISLGYNVSDGEGSFSLAINPAAALSNIKNKGAKNTKTGKHSKKRKLKMKVKQTTRKKLKESKTQSQFSGIGRISLLGSSYGLFSHSDVVRATQITSYTGVSTNVTISVLPTGTPLELGPSFNLFGTYSRIANKDVDNLKTFGYMYSSEADDEDMMDYYIEKGSTYNKRDKFLGIPFNNADNFIVTGEGIGGGFRMYNKEAGHFHPNEKKSTTYIFNAGVEVEAGLNFGGGGDVGAGVHTLKITSWKNLSGFANAVSTTIDEPVMFRFNNDLGGFVEFGNNDIPQKASILGGGALGNKSFDPSITGIVKTINNGNRSGRSSYIGYNTNKEMLEDINGVHYRTYSKRPDIENFIERGTSNLIEDEIGEIVTFNEAGTRYVYGLPVFSRNEKNMQYDLRGVSAGNIKENYLAFRDISNVNDLKIQVGEVRNTPYATSYLLTEITTSDYVDRTMNGPTEDDFGGWTKFNYKREYITNPNQAKNKEMSSSNLWYKWRFPYNGLLYSRNEMSDPNDDVGTVMAGEKEIYYIKSIETKSHKAVFITSDREDGIEAADNNTAANNQNAKGTNKLQKLDRIELFAKREDGSLRFIKIVNFEYDYSLCGNVINNTEVFVDDGFGNNLNANNGKLTLKKVWFEYEDVFNAKISPYRFEYQYPTVTDADYPTRYDSLENYGSYSVSEQNQPYSPFDLDAWGNYQFNGKDRYNNMQSWVNQDPSLSFDPAAWQLKVIKLPSGGEIHVQYEQDDYSYVQNKLAHAMVSLKDFPASDLINKYYLNTDDLGLTTQPELIKLRSLINELYVKKKKKMYFKYLYRLIGLTKPNLDDCNTEYITGYANIKKVDIDGNGLWIRLGNPGFLGNVSNHDLPRKVCRDLLKTQKAGKVILSGNCNAAEAGVFNGNNAKSIVQNFLGFAVNLTFPSVTCAVVNFEKSYLRVPLINAKKGGGLRVKRLLMYDRGIETGYPELYGSEYIYKFFDEDRGEIKSSGVATNEPSSIREENILVDFMERFKQSFVNKVIAGRDKKQAEGPLGETILPAPSVGYSRVVIKNIHSGKTNTGFTINEFHTAREHPVKAEMTEIKSKKDYLPIPTGFVNMFINNLWVSQGFSFILNNMHGQVKSISTYAGDYSDIHNPDKAVLSTLQEFTYFKQGEKIPMSRGIGQPLSYENPGKEMDITFESKAVKDINLDGNVEFDTDGGIFFIVIVPFFSIFPSLTYTETELYTHSTSKIIRYPAIVKSTKTYQDGIYHLTENIAFNPETGKPIITKTSDGFDDLDLLTAKHDGSYTNYVFPASFEYGSMSQKAKNEKKIIHDGDGGVTLEKTVSGDKHYLLFTASGGGSVCDVMNIFAPGDLIKLSTTGEIYNIGNVTGNKIEMLKLSYGFGLYSVTTGNVDVEIIHSGRTNQLSTNVGSITTYGPEQTIIETPIDPAILAPYNNFVTALNNAISSQSSTISFSDSIQVLSSIGECIYVSADDINLTYSGNQVTIRINIETVTIPVPIDSHPLVVDLNMWLDSSWGFEIQNLSSAQSLNLFNCSNTGQDFATLFKNNNSLIQEIRDVTTINSIMTKTYNITGNNVLGSNILQFTTTAIYIADLINNIASLTFQNFNILLNPEPPGYWWWGNATKNYGINDCGAFEAHGVAIFTNLFGHAFASYHAAACHKDFVADTTINLNNAALFTFVNSTKPFTQYLGRFGNDSQGFLTFESFSAFCVFPPVRIMRLSEPDSIPKLLCEEIFNANGTFDVDENTGNVIFFEPNNNCFPKVVECLRVCENNYPGITLSNVIASNAQTYTDIWPYDENIYSSAAPSGSIPFNVFEKGERGKWRSKSNYTFNTDLTANAKIYNAGTYTLDLFSWQNEAANDPTKWLKLNTVTKYSPNGNAIEEVNILGIHSSAKFGYDNTLPYLVAQNATNSSVSFESFEKQYVAGGNIFFEDGMRHYPNNGDIITGIAHSGNKSFKLKDDVNVNGLDLTEISVTQQTLDNGLTVKAWVKTDLPDISVIENNLKAEVRYGTTDFIKVTGDFQKVARTGAWTLYEAKLNGFNTYFGNPDDPLSFQLYIKYYFTGGENIWIDDIRVQPSDAQMITYVYDVNSLRLLTSFDDQHFGLYYQYSEEGKLIRKIIETERGIKTIQETQYNIPLILR